MSWSTSESQNKNAEGFYLPISTPKSMPLTEFTEASQELAYELCSPGRCDKCLEEEIRKGQGAAMRKEQKKEAQDKMPGKDGTSGE